ncbi:MULTISPECIES: hypothetical protein [Bradyrhizobium]|uniref:hypothetical protein n=1 Tax=Bradyrhizobium TaxID=374 RepID=UPI000485DB15|nr:MULTISPECIES: hypothetical protein [Bradyrhizobium]QOG17794.1 hypothetical protein FOM02_11005 [Bradyrhizobium sp. SEMIA]UFW45639.1 hypothetical protein BaraCB756_25295 [Bradyrhizobium arachidis]
MFDANRIAERTNTAIDITPSAIFSLRVMPLTIDRGLYLQAPADLGDTPTFHQRLAAAKSSPDKASYQSSRHQPFVAE